MALNTLEQVGKSLPRHFSVALIMQQSPSDNPWIDHRWDAIGILAEGTEADARSRSVQLIQEQSGVRRYLHRGFNLQLHVDECESYYHNLLAPDPCCYVVATLADDGTPQPVLLTLSFDEAHAYLEGEETLYTVALPPEIHQWIEAFVLANYVPTKRTKRKRQDWRQGAGSRRP